MGKTDLIKEIKIDHVRMMLHDHPGGEYIEPNRRYSPYPTAYRNHYQIDVCSHWDLLVEIGYAVKGKSIGLNYYSVSEEGKSYLWDEGYKWHEEKRRK